MGRSCTRRSSALRVPHSGRRAGGIELEHNFEKARKLPKSARWISPGKDRRYGKRDVQRLLRNDGIVRNRLKIAATIENAKRFRDVERNSEVSTLIFGALSAANQSRIVGETWTDVPARTAESDAMSRDLLRRGFKFVGSTICYAFMQATGMVNDHLVTCPRHAELGGNVSANKSITSGNRFCCSGNLLTADRRVAAVRTAKYERSEQK
jgi:DNA-3-methyladenine glycosylase I